MSIKNISRLRRARKTRMNIREQETPRLTVYRSSKHFYAQVFDSLGTKVIASASTVEKDLESKSNNVESAEAVGKRVAERAIENGIKKNRDVKITVFISGRLSFFIGFRL